jgi:hypothetical protein
LHDHADVGPVFAEFFEAVGFPLFEDFIEEIRGIVEVGAGEIEDLGRLHDCHFNDEEFIAPGDHLGNVVAKDFLEFVFGESHVNVFLGEISLRSFKYFDSDAGIRREN